MMRLSSKLGAEFIGTYVLVFGGTGAAVLAAKFLDPAGGNTGLGIGFLGVSLAFGLTVLTMAYAVGHISGGHFNPAITIGLATAKRFEWKEALPYIVTQVVAAIAASATLWIIAIGQKGASKDTLAAGGFAANGYGDHSPGLYNLAACLIIEVVLTAVFLAVIMGTTDKRASKGLRRARHRLGAHPDPPHQHPRHQHVGEPRPLHRAGDPAGHSAARAGRSASCGSSGSPRSLVASSERSSTVPLPVTTRSPTPPSPAPTDTGSRVRDASPGARRRGEEPYRRRGQLPRAPHTDHGRSVGGCGADAGHLIRVSRSPARGRSLIRSVKPRRHRGARTDRSDRARLPRQPVHR